MDFEFLLKFLDFVIKNREFFYEIGKKVFCVVKESVVNTKDKKEIGMSEFFFPPGIIDRCFEASTFTLNHCLDSDPIVFGVTTKGGRADKTVIFPIRGNDARISYLPRVSLETQNPVEIIEEINKIYMGEGGHVGYSHHDKKSVLVVDTTYPGNEIVDETPNCDLYPINPIDTIDDPLCVDERSFLYLQLKKKIEKCEINLPNDNSLKEELKAITYTLREKDNKIVIDSKQKIKENLGRFPDLAETLMLTQVYQPTREHT